MNKIIVQVPATSANCGPGFDCLGLALNLYNTFEFSPSDEASDYTFSFEGFGAELLSKEDQSHNLVTMSMEKVFAYVGEKPVKGHIHSKTEIPPSRGLGSSATAIVGGLLIANSLISNPLKKDALLLLANEIEGHPDNVCPAIFGNFCVAVAKDKNVNYTRISLPESLRFVVIVPDILVATHDARAVLPKSVSYKDAVSNVGGVALLVASLNTGKVENIGVALEDMLHVPYRAPLIPGSVETLENAKRSGALGATISGSGSTLIAFTLSNEEKIAQAMLEALKEKNITAKAYYLQVDEEGARVLSS